MAGNQPAQLPKGRTLVEFLCLKPAEKILQRHAAAGTIADIGDMRPDAATDDNTVRAAFIRFLALGGDGDAPIHEKGVRLRGAWIEGVLDLEGAGTTGGLCLLACHFDTQPFLADATISGSLILNGSSVPGLTADRLTVVGSLFLDREFDATDSVQLINAKISGNFRCSGWFQNTEAAIIADQISVGGSVSFGSGFIAYGEVSLMGGRVHGTFDCKSGRFLNGEGTALNANGLEVGGGVVMTSGFSAVGTVGFLGAKIIGDLDCRGGHFCFVQGRAIGLDGASVSGAIFMGAGFVALGEVRLVGAKIGGDLECSDGQFCNPDREALNASKIAVAGDVYFCSRFMACGMVNLVGACIGGSIRFDGRFLNGSNIALNAERFSIAGTLSIGESFRTKGDVNLLGAQARFLNDHKISWPDSLILDGFVYDALLHDSPVTGKDRISWLDHQPPQYSGKAGSTEFRPQPWLHLRNVLRTMGHYEVAREVGVAFETRKRRCGLIGGTPETPSWWCPTCLWPAARRVYRRTANILHLGYGELVDYGYRPLKLLFIAAFFWLYFAGVFYGGAEAGVFAPAKTTIFTDHALTACAARPDGERRWAHCVPPEYPQFYPLVYSLNVLLPVGNLGQESAWRPMTTTCMGWLIQVLVWFETLFGWVASLILVAVVSGLAKRDE